MFDKLKAIYDNVKSKIKSMSDGFLIDSQEKLDKIVQIKYFKFDEMKCKNCCEKLFVKDIAVEFFKLIDEFREYVGKPLQLTNLYRCKVKNNSVGGAANSGHIESIAADIYSDDFTAMELYNKAFQFGKFFGMGFYPDQHFVHVDIKDRVSFWLNCNETGNQNEYFETYNQLIKRLSQIKKA